MRMCTSLGLSSFEVRPRISLVTYMLANSCIFHFQRCKGINGDFSLWKFLLTTRSDIIGLCLWHVSWRSPGPLYLYTGWETKLNTLNSLSCQDLCELSEFIKTRKIHRNWIQRNRLKLKSVLNFLMNTFVLGGNVVRSLWTAGDE